jgi:hypothetical protein
VVKAETGKVGVGFTFDDRSTDRAHQMCEARGFTSAVRLRIRVLAVHVITVGERSFRIITHVT